MTMNLPLCTIEAENVLRWKDNELKPLKTIPTSMDWVTDGNFALKQGDNYVSLEEEHFDEIIGAIGYKGETEPPTLLETWTPERVLKVPPRGFSMHPNYLLIYMFGDLNILIESRM